MTREKMWEEFETGIIDVIERWKKRLEQEPCGDAISRQYLLDNCVVDKVSMPYVPINRIENAPSVKPQDQTGQWIFKNGKYRCDACGEKAIYCFSGSSSTTKTEILSKYCPNCGKKMEVRNKE